MSEDFVLPIRIIPDEESELYPVQEQPPEPTADQQDELMMQINVERLNGHPALAVKEQFRARGLKVE